MWSSSSSSNNNSNSKNINNDDEYENPDELIHFTEEVRIINPITAVG